MRFLYLVWTNLMRKKLRTLLTLLSILVAFLLFGYLGAIRQGFHIGGFKAFQARMLVVIQHAQQAQALLVKRLGRATELTARSMTNTALPVAQATRWQYATMT